MNSFDCELGELFSSENLANMGNHSNQTNDVFLEIFKVGDRSLSVAQLDLAKSGLESGEFVSSVEPEFQNQEIFDLIGDPCFKGTPNYCSLSDLDEVLDAELPKCLSSEQARSCLPEFSEGCDSLNNYKGQINGNDLHLDVETPGAVQNSENRDSCIHKIVDLLATIVDETSPNCEINFNTDLLQPLKDSPVNLSCEVQICKETLNPKLSVDSLSQTSAAHSDIFLNGKLFNNGALLTPSENFLLESIPQTELENVNGNHPAPNLDNSSESSVSACQQPENIVPPCQILKPTRKPLLPQLTEFSCKICQPRLFFLSKDDFLRHNQFHDRETKEQKFRCQECKKKFSVYNQYLNHIRHHQKKKCKICLKEFLPTSLKNHLQIHDLSQRLLCERCGLRFVSKIKLDEHSSRVHFNEKPYICELCNRRFSHHGSYWIHKKNHICPPPFNCSCGEAFQQSSALVKHCRLCGCSKNLDFDISTSSTSLVPHEFYSIPNAVGIENRTLSSSDSEQVSESCNSSPTEACIDHPSIDSSAENNESLSTNGCKEIYGDLSANRCNSSVVLRTIGTGVKTDNSFQTDLGENITTLESCTNISHFISTKTSDSNGECSGISSENSESSSGYLSASNSVESNDSAVINHVDDSVELTASSECRNDSSNFKIVVSKCPKRELGFKACSEANLSTVQRVVGGELLQDIKKSPFQCERCLKNFFVKGSFLRHQKSLLACNLEIKKQLQSKLEVTDRASSKASSALFVCEKCLKSFPFKWSLSRHQKSPTACSLGLKKRLQREQEALHNIPKKKVFVPKLNSAEPHCPHCNIQFPDFESFLFHFQNKCNH